VFRQITGFVFVVRHQQYILRGSEKKNMISSLLEVPEAENSQFEFKSSKTESSSLGRKLCKAASAFSNSGGGTFIVGLNDEGIADGGIAPTVGRTSISDWIDTKLQLVRPAVNYTVKIFEASDGRGLVEQERIVLTVESKRR